MKPRRTIRLSAAERAARAARMRALNADPEVRARRRAGRAKWSSERREAQAKLLRALNADPDFILRKRAGLAAARIHPSKIPLHSLPVVRGLFVEMNAQRATLADIGSRAGIGKDTIRFWRFRAMPRVDLLDAALNTLDLELAIVPIGTRDANGFATKGCKR